MDQPSVVLLAESDAIVGVDLNDALAQAGYRVLGPAETTAEALGLLEQTRPTLAVIDVQLKDGRCTQLIRQLRERGVPFLVHSGVRQDQRLNSDVRGAPWLTKPALPWDVVALCDELSLSSGAALKDGVAGEHAASVQLIDQTASGSRNPLIAKLEGFTGLSEADRAILGRICAAPHAVPPHTDLAREGDKPEGVILILGGMACRHKALSNGARQISAYLLPGDLCDLDVALLARMDHTITTLSACQVVRIPPNTVADLMQLHPAIARALRMSTLVDEATLREWLLNVGRRSALERIAHLFCELLVRLREVGSAEEDSYALPLTEADLADTTGLSTVHVNRSLQELQRRGLIDLTNGQLKILNLSELRLVGGFQDTYLHLGDRAAA